MIELIFNRSTAMLAYLHIVQNYACFIAPIRSGISYFYFWSRRFRSVFVRRRHCFFSDGEKIHFFVLVFVVLVVPLATTLIALDAA